jgi:hypothetical protein
MQGWVRPSAPWELTIGKLSLGAATRAVRMTQGWRGLTGFRDRSYDARGRGRG